MRLTYRQVQYLREVARQDSIAAACKVLAISQSSVLAAIDAAENVTGTQLFTRRKGHGIALTPAGRTFLISANRFLASGEEFSRALENFSETSGTSLRIGCFVPFGAFLIPPVVRRFIDAHGDCEITLLEGDQTELRAWLAAGEVDLIVTYDIGQEFGSNITPICKFPTHALVNRQDAIADLEVVSLKTLVEHPLILLDLPETRVYLLGIFDSISSRPKIGLRTRSYETVRSAVSNGLGVSILNTRPTPETIPDSPNLARVPIKEKLRQPTLFVADPYGDQKPAGVKAFINVLHRYIVELGPQNFAVVHGEHAEDLIYPPPPI
jgi:molybdate transport repressor ModE-like protein